jgi:peptide/nickel transport system substrate-binding protein
MTTTSPASAFASKAVTLLLTTTLLGAPMLAAPAASQKSGGILRIYSPDSPGTLSPMEEPTAFAVGPAMGIFNNLVLFDQDKKQNSLETLTPDLATSWSTNDAKTEFTFQLRQGVKWHDGKPFTSADVVCSWNYQIEKGEARLRVNPRRTNYNNLDRIEAKGDHAVTLYLKRPQPAFPMLLGGGVSAVYPCHVPPEVMRRKPVGTGPFRFVDFKANQIVTVERNPYYWKPGRPYLDGIEWHIMRSVGTALLAFAAKNVDMTFPSYLTIAQQKDVKKQVPTAECEEAAGTVNRHVIINRKVAPFDSQEIRRALALAIDRKAFIDIISEGQGDVGAILQPSPGGLWGVPPDLLKELPGYDPDVTKNRKEAREIMEKLGYGPQKRLKFKLTTRDIPIYRDPAVILLDQIKEVHFEGELEVIETAAYFNKVRRQDFVVGLNLQTSGPDPDQVLEPFYGCGAINNWDAYCNPEIDKLIAQQSIEGDPAIRRALHWQIEKRLGMEATRPIIFYPRGATCRHPHVKGLTVLANSFFNGYRFENVWLER